MRHRHESSPEIFHQLSEGSSRHCLGAGEAPRRIGRHDRLVRDSRPHGCDAWGSVDHSRGLMLLVDREIARGPLSIPRSEGALQPPAQGVIDGGIDPAHDLEARQLALVDK